MRPCSKCGEVKDESEFSPARSGGGRVPTCKQCKREYMNAKYKTDPEYRRSCKERRSRIPTVSVCKTIQEHHKKMATDPERLTTKFIQDLIGTRCKKP